MRKRSHAPRENITRARLPKYTSLCTHCVSRPRLFRHPKSKGDLVDNPWVERVLLAIFSTVGSSYFKSFMPGDT
nr:hypothetical protein [Candidatus Sigynarchaeum springense]